MDIIGKVIANLAHGAAGVKWTDSAARTRRETESRPRTAAPFSSRVMFFGLKKLVSVWLMPLPLCLVLLAVGLWLMRSSRRARLGRGLLMTGIFLLFVFSNRLLSSALVRPLEERYAAIPEIAADAALPPSLARCRYVVVLGSGNGNTPGRAALNELSQAAHGRLAEAVRLIRRLPDAQLVLCGPADGKYPTHASALARAAVSLGIDRDRIVLIENVRDTEDESLAVRQRVGTAPCAVVTSAWHMPRAVALCRHAGLDALPCPTDYSAHSDGKFHFTDLFWDLESLQRSTWGVRERLGLIWITLRGKT
jgi:uncharacterized SAM-binding protein YcdF (DUF218 family)